MGEGSQIAQIAQIFFLGPAEIKEIKEIDVNKLTDQELAVWYNDHVIYPDKVRLNCYYYRHYSFIKDIQMILCTVFGKKMKYAGETI